MAQTFLTNEDKVELEQQIGKLSAEKENKLDAAAYGLPILKLTGDVSAMTKDNAVDLSYEYGDMSGTASVKWQGSSSIAWEKKNYTIKFDQAFEAAEGWGEQKKYCFKANFIDHSHARNLVNAKLWGQIVKSRDIPTGFKNTTGVVSSDVYIWENDVLTTNYTAFDYGLEYLYGFSLPAGEFKMTCDVCFPDGATELRTVHSFWRKDTNVSGAALYNAVSAAGVWETITSSGIIYSAGGDTYIGLAGEKTKGVKFKNIRFVGTVYGKGAATYYFSPIKQIQALPNGGAVDGFPCVIMLNGEFHGLYTWNIPKDGWMFGMDDSTIPQAILCADTQNDACGFKAAATLTNDFDLEYVSDESNSAWVLTSLNTLISACMNTDGTDLDTTVARYLDWDSAIDYLIFTALLGGNDMYRKNYLLATYDGTKWFFSAYDMDTTYGLNWKGTGFYSSNVYPKLTDFNHKVMELIKTYKADELKARYDEIRNRVMSEDNLYLMFTNWAAGISSSLLLEDAKKWPTLPSTSASNTAQILNWYRLRSAIIDNEAKTL